LRALERAPLISDERRGARDGDNRPVSLGHYHLRGVREPKEIFALA
jgi:hypothetical protein